MRWKKLPLNLYRGIIFLSVVIFIFALYLFFMAIYPITTPIKQKPLVFSNPNDQRTYSLWFKRIQDLGGTQAYREFKTATEKKEVNKQHRDAHLFGEALYQVEGSKGISVCDTSFSYGCYHSFLGSAINTEGLEIASSLSKNCFDHLGKDGLACQHGIGHGILSSIGYDFESLVKSLDSCDNLEIKDPIGGCLGGVFMEYNFQTMLLDDGKTRQFQDNNPYFPCFSINKKFASGCIYQQAQWWLSSVTEPDFNQRIEKIDSLCLQLPSGKYQVQCYKGLGVNILAYLNYDTAEAKKICASLKEREAEIICRSGVSISLLAIPNLKESGRELCQDGLTKKEQGVCFLHTDQVLASPVTELPKLTNQ